MANVYTFTDDERVWVAEARAEYERRLMVIIQIHKVQGNLGPAPNGSGIEKVPTRPAPPLPDIELQQQPSRVTRD